MDLSDVRVVFGPDDMGRVGAFRYRIYVEEQGKQPPHADHARRRLIEPADRRMSSIVLALERGGELVGTLRTELFDATHEEARWLQPQRFGMLDAGPIMLFTRLMVAASARRSDVTPKLLWLGFNAALLKNCRLGVLTCRPSLVPVFEQYGCLQYAPEFMHPEQGAQVPMAILGEVDYLRERAAPLAEWLHAHRADSPHTPAFLDCIARFRAEHANLGPVRDARSLVA